MGFGKKIQRKCVSIITNNNLKRKKEVISENKQPTMTSSNSKQKYMKNKIKKMTVKKNLLHISCRAHALTLSEHHL